MRHFYCDESGGTRGETELFVVTVIAVGSNAARRIIKDFRRATGWSGEIKGAAMGGQQQDLFLQLTSKEIGSNVETRVCDRQTALGGWAASTMKEHDIYAEMLYEACCGLISRAGVCAGVTADGGRYNRPTERKIASDLDRRLQVQIAATRGRRIVNFDQSQNVKGLQVADVAVNFLARHVKAAQSVRQSSQWLQALLTNVQHVSLAKWRPSFLSTPAYP